MDITIYHLMKSGSVQPNGSEIESKLIKAAPTKVELIKHAKKLRLDPDAHFINTIVYKRTDGLLMPETVNEHPEYIASFDYKK